MKTKSVTAFGCALATLLAASMSHAHFGMLIPSTPRLEQQKKDLSLTLSFSHPFEGQGMNMEKPTRFFVAAGDKQTDLLPLLQEEKCMEHRCWSATYQVKRPGVYSFAMEPAPYWEPAEDVFIIHYTKAIVPAFGDDVGWNTPLGLPTEIIPLTRPFGNYSGNSFSGQVVINGKPAPDIEVEVEFYNEDVALQAASDYHVTQVVTTDANGVFTFTCPQSGWWGFAALSQADYTLPDPKGNQKEVELGAVLWVYMDEWQSR